METTRQDCAILSHQLCGQQGGGTSTHVAPWCERNLDSPSLRRETGWEREKDITWGDRKETGVREDRKIERHGGKEKDRKRDGLEERERKI